jgi:hypothetical protein
MPFQRIPRVSDLLPGAIKGLWTIGDTSSWHIEIGTHPADGSPTAGESGIRLYGADGLTALINLSIGGTPTITGAIVQTAATGERVVLDGPGDALEFYSGNAGVGPAIVRAVPATNALGLDSPQVSTYQKATLNLLSATNPIDDSNIALFANAIALAAPLIYEGIRGNPLLVGVTQSASITLDANGEYIWFHGLGIAPSFVAANFGLSATSYSFETGGYTSSQATIRGFVTSTGARAASVTGQVHLLAVVLPA